MSRTTKSDGARNRDIPKRGGSKEKFKRSSTRSPEKQEKKPARNLDRSKSKPEPKSSSPYKKFPQKTDRSPNKTNSDRNGRLGKNKTNEENNRYGIKAQFSRFGVKSQNRRASQKGELGPDFQGKKIRVFRNGDFSSDPTLIGVKDGKFLTFREFLEYLNEKVKLNHAVSIKKLYTTLGIQILSLEKLRDGHHYVAASNIFTPGTYVVKKKEDSKLQQEQKKKLVDNGRNQPTKTNVQNGVNKSRNSSMPKPTRESSIPTNKQKTGTKGFANRRARSASPAPRGARAPVAREKLRAQQQPAAPQAGNKNKRKENVTKPQRSRSDQQVRQPPRQKSPPQKATPPKKVETRTRREPFTTRRHSDPSATKPKPTQPKSTTRAYMTKVQKTLQKPFLNKPPAAQKKQVTATRRQTYRVDQDDGLREPVRQRSRSRDLDDGLREPVAVPSLKSRSQSSAERSSKSDKAASSRTSKVGSIRSRISQTKSNISTRPTSERVQENGLSSPERKSPSEKTRSRSSSKSTKSVENRSPKRNISASSSDSDRPKSGKSSRSDSVSFSDLENKNDVDDDENSSHISPEITHEKRNDDGMAYEINYTTERALIHDSSSERGSSPGNDSDDDDDEVNQADDEGAEDQGNERFSAKYSSPGRLSDVRSNRSRSPAEAWQNEQEERDPASNHRRKR